MAFTIPPLNTPIRFESEQPERVTVTDPAHPLYGRTFTLVAWSGAISASGQVIVAYQDDIQLKISVLATSLCTPSPTIFSRTKLSDESIRDIVKLSRNIQVISRILLHTYKNIDTVISTIETPNTDIISSEIEP